MSEGYIAIADNLESKIRSGELKPNEALPNTRELAKTMNVSLVTMQRCMKRLHERGLVRRSQQKGTFVSSSVNSRSIGLMIGKNPFLCESPFYRLVVKAYCELAPSFGSEIKLYLDMVPDDPFHSIRMAERDIAEGNLKTLLFTGHTVTQLEWLQKRALCPCLEIPSMDIYDMAYTGTAKLLAAGRRKIKVISIFIDEWPPDIDTEVPGVEAAFKDAELTMPPGTVVRCGDKPEDAYNFVAGLLQDKASAPDGLLIDHDIVASGALFAIAKAGLSVPEDISVICHQNKDAEIFSPFKIDMLKSDNMALVRGALERASTQSQKLRNGFNKPDLTFKTVYTSVRNDEDIPQQTRSRP